MGKIEVYTFWHGKIGTFKSVKAALANPRVKREIEANKKKKIGLPTGYRVYRTKDGTHIKI